MRIIVSYPAEFAVVSYEREGAEEKWDTEVAKRGREKEGSFVK